MIKLDIEEYCHNCPYFEPVNACGGEYYSDERLYFRDYVLVQCENKVKCQHAARFVEGKK